MTGLSERKRIGVGAALLLSLGSLLLAGCGGGSEEDLTRNAFIADADAVCAEFNATSSTREASFNEALKSSDLETAADDFREQATAANAMLDELAAVEAPVGDQPTVDEIIALGRQRADAANEAADAIAAGDKEAMIAAGKEGALLAGQYDQMADSFGLVDCGSGGADSTASGATGDTGPTS